MRYVPPLPDGGVIGIVSPSYPYAVTLAARYGRAIDALHALGYKTKIGSVVTTSQGFVTGSAKARADDINAMFADAEVDAILCVNGGTLAAEVLEHLDYDLIREHPKPFIGYSDATSILIAIATCAGIPTFHGPMLIPQFGEFPQVLEYTLSSMHAALSATEGYSIAPSVQWTDEFLDARTGQDLKPRTMQENPGWSVIREGDATGTLICGNLRIICSLLGTRFAPSFDDAILVLEDVDLKSSELRRHLTHLRQAGAFEKARAVAFGRLHLVAPKDGIGADEVVRGFFKDDRFPLVMGLDVGHTDPVATVPIGVAATLSTGDARLRVKLGPCSKA